MAIAVSCSECGRKYAVAPKMIGKRVRCKQCGGTFLVAPAGGDGGVAPSASGLEEMTASAIGRASVEPSTTAGSRPLLQPGIHVVQPRPSALEDGPFDFDTIAGTTYMSRSSVASYPGAATIDPWLATGMLVLSLGWIILQSWLGDDSRKLAWEGLLRPAVVLLLYSALVFPILMVGVRKASTKANFDLPLDRKFRTFSVFLFPVALAYCLWLESGPSSAAPGFVVGLLLGTGVALVVAYYALRMRPPEIAPAMPLIAGSFLSGAILATLLLVGINQILKAILPTEMAQQFRDNEDKPCSPLGPGLSWVPPPPDQPAKTPPARKHPATTLPAIVKKNPATLPATMAAAPPGTPLISPPPSTPTTVPSVTPGTPTAVVPTVPQPPVPATPTTPAVPAVAVVVPAEPIGTVLGKPAAWADGGAIDSAIYPAVAGPALAVIHADGANAERVEVLSATDLAKPMEKIGSARFARPMGANGSAAERYAISPDGASLASIVQFPSLGAQIWSFATGTATQIPLPEANGTPTLVGFTSPDTLLVQWQGGNRSPLELYSIKTQQRIGKAILLPERSATSGNGLLTPDGKSFITAGRTPTGDAALFVIDLRGGGAVGGLPPGRRLKIPGVDAQFVLAPSGLAVSTDGQRIAALFEDQTSGSGLLLYWKLGTSVTPVVDQVYPAGVLPTRPAGYQGSALAWVGDAGADAVSIYGRALYDGNTAKLLGDTGVANVLGQHAMPGTTLQMLIGNDTRNGSNDVRTIVNDKLNLMPPAVPAAAQ